jgi:hypothetical protein
MVRVKCKVEVKMLGLGLSVRYTRKENYRTREL